VSKQVRKETSHTCSCDFRSVIMFYSYSLLNETELTKKLRVVYCRGLQWNGSDATVGLAKSMCCLLYTKYIKHNFSAEVQQEIKKVIWQRLHRMTPPCNWQTDGQTPHTSVTIVCISCIRCSLKLSLTVTVSWGIAWRLCRLSGLLCSKMHNSADTSWKYI